MRSKAQTRINGTDLLLEQTVPGGPLTLTERTEAAERRVTLAGDLAVAMAADGQHWYVGGPLGHPSAPATTAEVRLVNRSGAIRFAVMGYGVWLAVIDRTPANDDLTVEFGNGSEILDQFSVHIPEMIEGDDEFTYYAPRDSAKRKSP